MKKKVTLIVCDNCGAEVADGSGATVNVKFTDRRKGRIVADNCEKCADVIQGQRQKAHGRAPAAAV